MSTISLYPHIKETVQSEDISIDTVLQKIKDGYWQDQILNYRKIPEKKKDSARNVKGRLPYITISGKFKNRNDKGLEKHSGFIAIDIDDLGDRVNDIKSELACDKYCYALFVSTGGFGLCFIAKINPKLHDESFEFLSEYLYKAYGVTEVDEKCKEVSRPRFISYDPDLFINIKSEVVIAAAKPKAKKQATQNFAFVEDDFNNIIEQISSRNLDLTSDYGDWVKIGFALVNKFGENGRNYFHAISQYNDSYEYVKADKKYSHLLKTTRNDVTIGFIYWLAKQQGLTIYSQRTSDIIRSAKNAKKAGLSAETLKKNLVKYQDLTEQEVIAVTPLLEQALNENVTSDEENLVLDIKEFLRQNYDLRRNLISRNIEIGKKAIDDIILNSIFIKCRTHFDKATKDLVNSIIFSDFTPAYNPFFELLKNYDGIDQTGAIDVLCETINTDTNHHELYIKKWFVSMVASLHGKHSPLMLVFCGGQNTGKTHWFRHLLPDSLQQFYAESKLDLGKDDEILMTKKLIIMDDEMGGKSKQEQKKLKEMTSKQTFSIREPYGRVSVDLQRLAMLCGTTNDQEILNDPTGNRRILPIMVNGIDQDKFNAIDKGLLFHDAYLLYKEGYNYNLDSKEIILLNETSSEFKQTSSEEDLISRYYGLPEDYPAYPALERTNTDMLSYMQVNSQVKLSQTKLGMILKHMGFEQKHKKVNKTTIRYYLVVELVSNLYTKPEPVNQPVNQENDPECPF